MSLHTSKPDHTSNRNKKQQITKQPSSTSWDQIKSLITCKQIKDSKIHDPSSSASIYTSCSNICTFTEVITGNSRVVHRADISPEGSTVNNRQDSSTTDHVTRFVTKKSGTSTRHINGTTSSRSINSVRSSSSTARGLQLRKLSGCYECHHVVDPSRYPILAAGRTTICACSECGEVFPKIESLEHHQAVRHAVSELGPEDSSRNIVEIIFKSSWLKKDNPICKIERILKVHNTQRTIQRFEDYREAVKARVVSNTKRNARCAADGNELLRFYSATLMCSLGSRGSSNLCGSIPACGVCNIIRHGFHGNKTSGTRTTASSGRAHDCLGDGSGTKRAMLVCRVIAGRVKHVAEDTVVDHEDGSSTSNSGSYDSVAGCEGVYSNLEVLFVFKSRAILPCFVVIYKALEF